MKTKLRVSVSQDGDYIKGHFDFPIDGTFVLETLAMLIDEMTKAYGLPMADVAADVYAAAMKGVKNDQLPSVSNQHSNNNTH